ncbi:hypothetical protein HG530_007755 [Fusarium avenaceum]|nr:hypothetical protein HG530_007755 [Fusarium avenaceum]
MSMVETRRSLLERIDDMSVNKCRSDGRISSSQTLSSRDDIRAHIAIFLKSEERPASTNSAHDFIEDQKNAVLPTDLSYAFEVSSWWCDAACCCAANSLCYKSNDIVWPNRLELCFELVDQSLCVLLFCLVVFSHSILIRGTNVAHVIEQDCILIGGSPGQIAAHAHSTDSVPMISLPP